MNISLLDIGISNIFSLKTIISALGYDLKIIRSSEELNRSDKIIFPGVGSYKSAIEKIRELHLEESLFDNIMIKKKPFLGICVGMQVLSDNGYEMGKHRGLGFVKGDVKNLKDLGCSFQVPHIGWNHVDMKPNILTNKINQNSDFYFIHSYSYYGIDNNNIIGITDYGCKVVAIINKDNIFGTQFHPEKSSIAGKTLIKNFLEI